MILKMKKFNVIFYTAIILIFAGCVSFSDEEIQKDISEVLLTQQKEWNSGNIDGYMAYYWHSDSLRFASEGTVTYGWEPALNRYKKAYADSLSMGKLKFSDISIKVINDQNALVFGKWELNRIEDHPWGLFTLHFKKILK